MRKLIKYISVLIGSGLIFSFIGGLSTYAYLKTRFTVELWHTINLEEEFTESGNSTVTDFESYRQLEERLFQELRENVYQTSPEQSSIFNRYAIGSLADPFGYEINWNRSFELKVDNPRGGILMLHGLTDSPYSVRSLAEEMHALGYWVVGLRLPGHGTIPAELTRMKWKDWVAASNLGATHVRDRIGPDLPFYIVGYSNGAALAVEYSLRVTNGEKIPGPEGLVLISPEISLPAVASLAKFQLVLARLPGLGKLAWESVMMEYDPFKYNSFPVNAGEQAYRLTEHIQIQLKKLQGNGKLKSFPRVIAFQSMVDATIQAEGVVDKLLGSLPADGHALVVYDVNQRALAEKMLAKTGEEFKSRLLAGKDLPFDLTVITNVNKAAADVHALQKKAMQSSVEQTAIPYAWPRDVYSLSHVALPFPPDDPIYGNFIFSNSKHIRLGRILVRGERGVFSIPERQLMRLRYNPFHLDMTDRIVQFIARDRPGALEENNN
jgi:alpha-beta hydrolase superfamily lysophospholipase